jgi:hypothetical protein
VNVRTLVSLDTETGFIRRYSETAGMTHEAALVTDPDDADKTLRVLEGFRTYPHESFRCLPTGRARTYDDALSEQIAARMAAERQKEQLLIADHSHRDEA